MRDRKKYCRKYHKKNREKILSRKKAYYEQNKKDKISYSKLDNHRLNKNRVNSGNSRTDNPEPSHQIANRLVEGAETKAEETIMPISALDKHNVCQDIVRHSEESEITVAMAIMQLHKEV